MNSYVEVYLMDLIKKERVLNFYSQKLLSYALQHAVKFVDSNQTLPFTCQAEGKPRQVHVRYKTCQVIFISMFIFCIGAIV